jgi:hypothetical protein
MAKRMAAKMAAIRDRPNTAANIYTSTLLMMCSARAGACQSTGLTPAHTEVKASDTYPIGLKKPSPPPAVNSGRNALLADLAYVKRTKSSERKYQCMVRENAVIVRTAKPTAVTACVRSNGRTGVLGPGSPSISRRQHSEHQRQRKPVFWIARVRHFQRKR